MSSFYTSLSGLNAFSTQIATISNNIANLETSGYKTSTISFAEAISSVISGSSSAAVGNGVTVDNTSVTWTQGDLTSTGNTFDLAVSGVGFFIVQDSGGTTYYTRDGGFTQDDAGNLVTDDGLVLQGYVIGEDGTLGSLGDINMTSYAYVEPVATTEISTTLNLSSGAEVADTFTSTIMTYDSLGNEIPIEITYTKTADNTWTWAAGIDSSYGTASGSGALTFNSDGSLAAGTDPAITLTLTNGATATQTVTWDLYDTTGATNDTVTQYSTESMLTDTYQDGNAAGTLSSISIDENGVICGTYSNNSVVELYQVALASFTNTDGLNMATNGYYQATASSGAANIGVSGTGSYGTIASGYLESSNVDLSEEMTSMIIAQHAYEACAKLISVEDEMIQTLINAT